MRFRSQRGISTGCARHAVPLTCHVHVHVAVSGIIPEPNIAVRRRTRPMVRVAVIPPQRRFCNFQVVKVWCVLRTLCWRWGLQLTFSLCRGDGGKGRRNGLRELPINRRICCRILSQSWHHYKKTGSPHRTCTLRTFNRQLYRVIVKGVHDLKML